MERPSSAPSQLNRENTMNQSEPAENNKTDQKSLIAKVTFELQERAEIEQELNAAIAILRKTASRLQSETVALDENSIERVTVEAVELANPEEQRLRELEATRDQAKLEAQERANREQRLNAEIKALRAAETRQQKRIKKIETRLREEQDAKNKRGKGKTKTTTTNRENYDRVQWLNAIGSETEAELRKLTKKEEQLRRQIAQLYAVEREHLAKIEELKTRLRERKKSIQSATETERGLEIELSSDQNAFDQARLQAEIDSKRLAESTQQIIELESRLRHRKVNEQAGPENQQSFSSEVESLSDDNQFRFKRLEEQAKPQIHIETPRSVEALEVSQARTASEEIYLTSIQEEMASSSQATSAAQAIDLVAQEKGIDVVDGEGSVPAIILDRLRSKDPAERTAGLFELAELGGDASFSLITKAFDDEVTDVRHAAAHALFSWRRDRAASFTRALRESTVDRRRRIGAALAGSGIANDAIDNLIGESREKTYDAFSILFLMAKAGEIQPLVRSIETHQDMNVRLAVISLLAFSNQPETTIPAFRRLAVRSALPAQIRSALMEAIHQISTQGKDGAKSAA
ncbi:MAG TPA: hypothetical protein VGQ39_02485 [Pyrinomonadaceae bacterium]|nr:hypothetical protein [Pyrinomonadaceae bacterium]